MYESLTSECTALVEHLHHLSYIHTSWTLVVCVHDIPCFILQADWRCQGGGWYPNQVKCLCGPLSKKVSSAIIEKVETAPSLAAYNYKVWQGCWTWFTVFFLQLRCIYISILAGTYISIAETILLLFTPHNIHQQY